MATLFSFLVIIGTILLSLGVVIGGALGIGWVLTTFLPFTLFEGTLLGLIASVIVGTFWNGILNIIPPFGSSTYFDDEDDEDFETYDIIPETRFYKTDAQKTWEIWLKYTLANRIYEEFQDWPETISMLKDKQQQELAIRVAEIAISLLKNKTARAKQLRVTMAVLKQTMSKIGQRPYDDDILRLAVPAINEEVDAHYEDIKMVIQKKLWDKPCPLFD